MRGCIFCKIVGGKLPAFKVYEDREYLAILDKFPVSRGHVLLMPKEHADNLTMMSDEAAKELGTTLKRITRKVDIALKPDGIKVVSNIREAAGQEVFHMHVHIIPVYGKSSDPYAAEIGVQRRTRWKDDKGIVPVQRELSRKEASELLKLLEMKD